MSEAILLSKIKNRIASKKNRLWRYCNVARISFCGYNGWSCSQQFKNRLQLMLGAYSMLHLNSLGELEKSSIIDLAEQSLRHEFVLLGAKHRFPSGIDWHVDFQSGFKWPKLFYTGLRANTPKGSDIKVPWELSRCQHLLWLGEAYLLTEDKRYAKEVIDEINWWIEDNPLMYSVNWTCSMDVAFRAVNWMYSLNMISKYEGFNDKFGEKVLGSLWQHGFFIRNNLEKQIPYSNNHYASDLVGLLYIGALFQQMSKGKKWFSFALKEYFNEVRQQVLQSGVHYERSVSYHRLMTELLSYPVYMLKRMGISIPSDIFERIQAMYSFTNNYTKPNGFAPLIGDNDDGRFVPFLKREFREHNYLNDKNCVENRFVSCGDEVLFHSVEKQSKIYADAGFAILRNKHAYLFISNGGYSKHPKETDITIGTHTHNDLLSFELNVNGLDIIVDPGTFLYTSEPAVRDEFRSTRKHNTILVDDEEQNGFVHPFVMKRNVLVGSLIDVNDTITGDYKSIQGGLTHSRSFSLKENCLIITDKLVKQGDKHKGILLFHFAKGLYPEHEKRGLNIKVSNYYVTIESSCHDVIIKDDTLSPSFGELECSKKAECIFEFSEETTIKTVIQWTKINNTK